ASSFRFSLIWRYCLIASANMLLRETCSSSDAWHSSSNKSSGIEIAVFITKGITNWRAFVNTNCYTMHMFKVILFDLDNTLYSEKCGIFDLIDQRMNEWLIANLQVPENEVEEFRHKYFMKYGTTLRGLMLHHDVNPYDFLHYVHDVPVQEFLQADQEL